MIIHSQESSLAGRIVKLKDHVVHPQFSQFGGCEFRVEDWNDRVFEKLWQEMRWNPACLIYAVRSAMSQLPLDNEVLYGKVGQFGHLVHISEIEELDGTPIVIETGNAAV